MTAPHDETGHATPAALDAAPEAPMLDSRPGPMKAARDNGHAAPPANDAAPDSGAQPATPAVEVLSIFLASLDTIPKVKQAAAALAPEILKAAASFSDDAPELAEARATMRSRKIEIGAWNKAVAKQRDERLAAEEEARQREARARAKADPSPLRRALGNISHQLQRNQNTGKPLANHRNLLFVLAHDPRWRDVLCYHALLETVWAEHAPPWHPEEQPEGGAKPGEWSEADDVRLAAWLSTEWEMDAKTTTINEVVNTRARSRVLDPPVDYFDSLAWDGRPRLDTWMVRHLGAENTTYVRAVSSRWMLSVVARQYEPGCKADDVLILEGDQGKIKSSALEALVPDPSWFSENDLDAGSKEDAQNIRGKVIQEIGELSTFSKGEVRKIKAFVSRKMDHYRASYDRRARDYPRRTIFAGTTNDEQYLQDPTGNRRFHPVRVSHAFSRRDVVEGIAAERDQLWAETVARYRKGEPWYIDTPELAAMCADEAEARRKVHPWEHAIGAYLDARSRVEHDGSSYCKCARCSGALIHDILIDLGKESVADQTAADGDTVRNILRVFGWSTRRDKQVRVPGTSGRRDRPYFPPEDTDPEPPAPPPQAPRPTPSVDFNAAPYAPVDAPAAAQTVEGGQARDGAAGTARAGACGDCGRPVCATCRRCSDAGCVDACDCVQRQRE